jgi:hypothetical protein
MRFSLVHSNKGLAGAPAQAIEGKNEHLQSFYYRFLVNPFSVLEPFQPLL